MAAPPSTSVLAAIEERAAVDASTFAAEVATRTTPLVLRGQVARWDAVAAGRDGDRAMATYLVRFGGGRPLKTMIGPPEACGRLFYNEDLSGFNFERQEVPLSALLGKLVEFSEHPDRPAHAIYANAATAPEHLPGWADGNPIDLPLPDATPRLWIGNETVVATHYDDSPNLACVVAGRRQFTVFPPEQVGNLYLGPLDRTPAGPPVSMVDPEAPDLARYPRYADAMQHARSAELEPGDAIFMPSLWWHHVHAFGRLNVLVNYWSEVQRPAPFLALVHAIMSVRDLPPAERAAWRSHFDHLVFADDAVGAADHLPMAARGVTGPASAERSSRLREFLLRALGRG